MTAGMERVRCPKCGGNTYIDKDCYGWFEKCICCGWSRDLPGIVLAEGEHHQHGGRYSPIQAKKPVDSPLGEGAAEKRKNGGA